MKSLFVALIMSFLMMQPSFAHADCDAPEAAWTACATDADCVVAKDACGWPAAYNGNFLAEVEKLNACLAPLIECATPVRAPPAQAVCSEGACDLPDEDEAVED